MSFSSIKIICSALCLVSILLTACGGSGATASSAGYTIRGAVSGLTGSVMLKGKSVV